MNSPARTTKNLAAAGSANLAAPRAARIEEVLPRIRAAIAPFRKAALFELAEKGFNSTFEQLVACLISIRTRDEATIPIAEGFFARARTPTEVARLGVAEIDALLARSTFHEAKAPQILAIAQRCVSEFGGALPCELETLLSFRGVGPKCAHLVLGIACGQAHIGVDIHVHRVTNRWGYVAAPTPEKTTLVLEAKLPREFWVEINALLVPFGKHICTGTAPKCSSCPVADMCQRVGVTTHR
jgi:endonuclease-3